VRLGRQKHAVPVHGGLVEDLDRFAELIGAFLGQGHLVLGRNLTHPDDLGLATVDLDVLRLTLGLFGHGKQTLSGWSGGDGSEAPGANGGPASRALPSKPAAA
jgi:hypothetical protein